MGTGWGTGLRAAGNLPSSRSRRPAATSGASDVERIFSQRRGAESVREDDLDSCEVGERARSGFTVTTVVVATTEGRGEVLGRLSKDASSSASGKENGRGLRSRWLSYHLPRNAVARALLDSTDAGFREQPCRQCGRTPSRNRLRCSNRRRRLQGLPSG